MLKRPLGERLLHPHTPTEVATAIAHQLDGWRVVAVYSGSRGAQHTVEYNGTKYRCTCQGFRIHKRGFCKHTNRAAFERDLKKR